MYSCHQPANRPVIWIYDIQTCRWEHLALLDNVLQRLRAAGLRVLPGKCTFGQEQLLYLGHLAARDTIVPDPATVMPTEFSIGLHEFAGGT